MSECVRKLFFPLMKGQRLLFNQFILIIDPPSLSAVSAVNMPTQDQEFEIGSKATLSGWGALGSSQSSPDTLYFNPNNEVVSDDQCQEMYDQIGLGSYLVPEVSCKDDDKPSKVVNCAIDI